MHTPYRCTCLTPTGSSTLNGCQKRKVFFLFLVLPGAMKHEHRKRQLNRLALRAHYLIIAIDSVRAFRRFCR